MWKDLFNILLEKFFILDDFYYPAMAASIKLLFKVINILDKTKLLD